MAFPPSSMSLCRRIHQPTLSVTIIILGASMMSTIFSFYYVKVFLNIYKISEGWFHFAQILYLVWNAINDPLFGLIQDIGPRHWFTSNRKRVIRICAPFYCVSFMLFWTPFSELFGFGSSPPTWFVGMHLIVALFCYDAVFSMCLLAHCGLFTEFTVVHSERVRFVKYMQSMTLIGLSVVFFVDAVSTSGVQNLTRFRLACFVTSILSFLCIYYTGTHAPDTIAQCNKNAETTDEEHHSKPKSLREMWLISRQILISGDFRRIVAANFFHILETTALVNFATIFVEALLPDVLPAGTVAPSVFYMLCATVPQLFVILVVAPCTEKFGAHFMLSRSRIVSVGLAVCMTLLGPATCPTWLLMLYMLTERKPLSAYIFSLNALFTKPAQSIAPMLVVSMLNRYGYEQYKETTGDRDPTLDLSVHQTMYYAITILPALFGLCEYLSLCGYTLKHAHKHTHAQEDTLLELSGLAT